MILGWLTGLLGEELLVRSAGRATRAVFGAEDERTLDHALAEAIRLVVLDTTAEDDDRQFAFDALRESLSAVDLRRTQSGSLLSDLREGFLRGCAALSEPRGEDEVPQIIQLGFTVPPDDLAARLTDEVVAAIGRRVPASSKLIGLVSLLVGLQTRELVDRASVSSGELIELRAIGEQAREVIGWLGVSDDPPRVTVMNHSSGPIFDVMPVPALIAYGSGGEVEAMVGHSALHTTRQVDPDHGYVWVLEHCRGWGQSPVIRGQLHFYFRDAAGRSWLSAHDSLSQARNPWQS